MKTTLTTSQVADKLLQDSNAKWTCEEARKIAEYYEQLEEDTGEEIELDVVSIRCERSSYTMEELVNNYGYNCDLEDLNKEEQQEVVLEYVENNAQTIKVGSNILIINF